MHRGEHMEAVRQALLCERKATGIHCHIGSQIFDDSPFPDGRIMVSSCPR